MAEHCSFLEVPFKTKKLIFCWRALKHMIFCCCFIFCFWKWLCFCHNSVATGMWKLVPVVPINLPGLSQPSKPSTKQSKRSVSVLGFWPWSLKLRVRSGSASQTVVYHMPVLARKSIKTPQPSPIWQARLCLTQLPSQSNTCRKVCPAATQPWSLRTSSVVATRNAAATRM